MVAPQDRIAANDFPRDWRYYTLGFPTARYRHFSWSTIVDEMNACDRSFYSLGQVLRRVVGSVLHRRQPLLSLVGNLSYRNNIRLSRNHYAELDFLRGEALPADSEVGAYSAAGIGLEAELGSLQAAKP